MIQIRSLRETKLFGMKLYIVPSIIILTLISLSSCKQETEFDGFADHTYNKISQTISISQDSIGLNAFLAEKYIGITAKEQRLLLHAKKNGLYWIDGVALPESDNPAISLLDSSIVKIIFDCGYTNYFYGYPSVIQTNSGTLVVAEKRVSETNINQFSDDVMITKSNNGNWSLTDFFKFAPYGNTWNGTRPLIGKLSDGRIVVKGKGLLVSNGDFQSWKHYPYAFEDLINSGKVYKDCGPMAYSSKFGLFFGTGQATQFATDSLYSLASLFSVNADLGKVTLAKKSWIPKVILADSSIGNINKLIEYPVFYSVEHSDFSSHKYDIIGFGVSSKKIYQFVYNYKEGDTFDSIRFQVKLTNITGSLIRESPIGIDYNPVTKRFEIMASSPYELDLYSISTDDLLNSKTNRINVAQWTMEAQLLNRDVTIRAQGLYPVSSIIDEVKKTQTVYFYAGQEYPARSGIFTLTRTLDTPKLSQFVAEYRAYLASVQF